jgi:hypothetical protein
MSESNATAVVHDSTNGETMPISSLLNRRFLEVMREPDVPNAVAYICSFPGDPADLPRGGWMGHIWTPRYATPRAETNNFVSTALFTPEIMPFVGPFAKRQRVFFACLRAILIDDVGTKVKHRVALAGGEGQSFYPTAIIETSPGNFQYWYLFPPRRYIADYKLAHKLVRRVNAYVDSSDVSTPIHYGRLPEGINGKAKYAVNGQPWQQKIVHADFANLHDPTEIHRRFAGHVPERARLAPEPVDDKLIATVNKRLYELGLFLRSDADRVHLICPWQHDDRPDTGTVWFAPSASNGNRGGFSCFHGRCQRARRTVGDFYAKLGVTK